MEISEESPPSCNTGAQNTNESGLVACVDWFAVTLKNVQDLQNIYDIFGLEISNFKEQKKGGKGYLKSTRFGNIAVYYEGTEEMGIHVEMTGQGCRQFEVHSSTNWVNLFGVLVLLDINVTRLDLAVDDYIGYFTINQIKRKIKEKCVRSRFKDVRYMQKTRLATAEIRGETLYFGSEHSMIQIRIYDKRLEREEKGFEVLEGVDHWIRTELQMRDERAFSAMLLLFNMDDSFGKITSGIIKNYLNFLVADKDKNKSRWVVCKWWERFLGDVDKLSLSIKAPDATIEKSYNWLNHQVETTLAMMYEAFNQDLSIFYDLINEGLTKFDSKHHDIIDRFKLENKNITYEDFLKKIKKDSNLR